MQQRHLPFWPYQEIVPRPSYEQTLRSFRSALMNAKKPSPEQLCIMGNQIALTLAEQANHSLCEAVCAQMTNAFVRYRDHVEVFSGGVLQPILNMSRLNRRQRNFDNAWRWLDTFREQASLAEAYFKWKGHSQESLLVLQSFTGPSASTEAVLLRLSQAASSGQWRHVCAELIKSELHNNIVFSPELKLCALSGDVSKFIAYAQDLCFLYGDQPDVLLAVIARVTEIAADDTETAWAGLLPDNWLKGLDHTTSLRNLKFVLQAPRLPNSIERVFLEEALKGLVLKCADRVAAAAVVDQDPPQADPPSERWYELSLEYIDAIHECSFSNHMPERGSV